jgi:hypothetical protein
MTRFLDGPAAGAVLMLQRAPFFLRAVRSSAGEWDALDQLDDTPRADEAIVVYQLVSEPSRVHVQRREKGRRVCGWYMGGDYRVAADPPTDAIARHQTQWEAWANTEGPKRCADVVPGPSMQEAAR